MRELAACQVFKTRLQISRPRLRPLASYLWTLHHTAPHHTTPAFSKPLPVFSWTNAVTRRFKFVHIYGWMDRHRYLEAQPRLLW